MLFNIIFNWDLNTRLKVYYSDYHLPAVVKSVNQMVPVFKSLLYKNGEEDLNFTKNLIFRLETSLCLVHPNPATLLEIIGRRGLSVQWGSEI